MNQRRTFLKNSLTLSASAVLAPNLIACSSRQPAKVVIIGAGLAGLNTARQLQADGIEPIVLEAKQLAGGRTWSIQAEEETINMGGIEIGDGYQRFLRIAAELGLDLVEPATSPKGLTIHYDEQLMNASEWPTHAANPLPESERDNVPSRLQFGYHLRDFNLSSSSDWLKPGFAHYDVSERQRLTQLGASETAIELINHAGNFNSVDDVSALHTLRALANFRFGGSKKTLRVVGGNNRLALGMAEQLADVRYKHAVNRIVQSDNGIQLDCENGSKWLAEKLVIAVPFSVLRHIDLQIDLPPLQRRAIDTLPYTGISKLVCRVNSPFWEMDGLPANLWSDSGLERGFISKSRSGNYLYTVFINGVGTHAVDELSEDAATQWILTKLADVRPATQGALSPLIYYSWGNDPFARGAYHAFAPGQIQAFAAEMSRPVGNVYFAGEHCGQEAAGMEAALESGERAAEQLLSAA